MMKQVKAEVKPDKEWVLYDDRFLSHILGNWSEVVENLSAIGGYPTVLLYERLDAADIHDGSSFEINQQDLELIVKKTLQIERGLNRKYQDKEVQQQQELLAYHNAVNEARLNNAPFLVRYYSFDQRDAVDAEFVDQESATKEYYNVRGCPKILAWGDAILKSSNYGNYNNIVILKQNFREEREALKKAREDSMR